MNRKSKRVLQEWNGYIEEIDDFHIYAKLEDITNPGTDEEVTFTWFDIEEENEALVKVGAIFHWEIGIVGAKPYSRITFAKSKPLTKKELADAGKRGDYLYKKLSEE